MSMYEYSYFDYMYHVYMEKEKKVKKKTKVQLIKDDLDSSCLENCRKIHNKTPAVETFFTNGVNFLM